MSSGDKLFDKPYGFRSSARSTTLTNPAAPVTTPASSSPNIPSWVSPQVSQIFNPSYSPLPNGMNIPVAPFSFPNLSYPSLPTSGANSMPPRPYPGMDMSQATLPPGTAGMPNPMQQTQSQMNNQPPRMTNPAVMQMAAQANGMRGGMSSMMNPLYGMLSGMTQNRQMPSNFPWFAGMPGGQNGFGGQMQSPLSGLLRLWGQQNGQA